MAITKRTRYEILRRDNNTCQYCGAKAPDVALHVDHMIPVALGGSDKADNLVTACRDCNAGKSSTPADSPIIKAVSQRSAEFAIVNLNRAARIEADLLAMEQYQEEFLILWNNWVDAMQHPTALPDGWRQSINAWWQINVPETLLRNAIEVAMTKTGLVRADRFRYAAGVVWRTLDDYDARYPATTNEGRVYSDTEMEDYGMDEWRRGRSSGERLAESKFKTYDFVALHIDGKTNDVLEKMTYARAD